MDTNICFSLSSQALASHGRLICLSPTRLKRLELLLSVGHKRKAQNVRGLEASGKTKFAAWVGVWHSEKYNRMGHSDRGQVHSLGIRSEVKALGLVFGSKCRSSHSLVASTRRRGILNLDHQFAKWDKWYYPNLQPAIVMSSPPLSKFLSVHRLFLLLV